MIYIRNLFTQDLRDGKQIAFPTEPSNIFFKFSFSNQDPERKISFKFNEKDSKSPYFHHTGKVINTRLYSAGSESRIDGELKQFLRDDLNAKVDDVIAFRAINIGLYEFELIPKGAFLYNIYKTILDGKNHEVVLEQDSNELDYNNNVSLFNDVDLGNLKEDFATWFIKQDGLKHNYFTDAFGSNRGKLLEQLNKYENLYKAQFGTSIFTFEGEESNKFISELEKNVYLEQGDFFQFSLKTSTHMPRAILGKKNYIKFLGELLAQKEHPHVDFNFKSFHAKTKEAGLNFTEKIVARFVASLCTKPFVICSGLSGSGKTKLAQSFVKWICKSEDQYKIVPVGADWTNREPLLGFPNGLETEKYVFPDSGVLQLIINAGKSENKNKPFFVILDEMNLSHVERYFADFLSIMESQDSIKLYSGADRTGANELKIEKEISWPENLFIIGTVNIDETTYMFSPKVLDRANVIEFRISETEITSYLAAPTNIDMNKFINPVSKEGYGTVMASNFLDRSKEKMISKVSTQNTLVLFFTELRKCGAEFGYRSASEINRLIALLEAFTKDNMKWEDNEITADDFIDIAIMQKLLPKLHGSRNKLTKILPVLGALCLTDEEKIKENYFEKIDMINYLDDANIKYRLSFEKICRMYKNAVENGYASYAEA